MARRDVAKVFLVYRWKLSRHTTQRRKIKTISKVWAWLFWAVCGRKSSFYFLSTRRSYGQTAHGQFDPKRFLHCYIPLHTCYTLFNESLRVTGIKIRCLYFYAEIHTAQYTDATCASLHSRPAAIRRKNVCVA